MKGEREKALPLVLGAVFLIEVIALGWEPRDREAWVLENLISVPLALTLVLARRRVALSSVSWCLVFAFLALHEVGSHYTYSQVPWLEWSRDGAGGTLDADRNQYDRFVHFAFGLLLARPLYEVLSRVAAASPAVLRLMAVSCVLSLSSLYEILEVAAALTLDPGVGIAFVGAQADVWDAQKDMGLALVGSLLGIVMVLRLQADRPELTLPATTKKAGRKRCNHQSIGGAFDPARGSLSSCASSHSMWRLPVVR